MKIVSELSKKNSPKAINNRILIKKDDPIRMKNGIHLIKKEGMYAPPYSGVIISIGPNVNDDDYKIGTRVSFTDIAGVEFMTSTGSIFSIRENDVTAIIPHELIVE